MPTPTQLALVDQWFRDVFTHGDLDALEALLAPDFVSHTPGGLAGPQGRESFKDWLQWYLHTFTQREWLVHDVIAEGDRVVVRYSGHITYQGGLLDIPPSNQRVLETGVLIFRVVEGMVGELWSEMSDLQVVKQLGALPGGA